MPDAPLRRPSNAKRYHKFPQDKESATKNVLDPDSDPDPAPNALRIGKEAHSFFAIPISMYDEYQSPMMSDGRLAFEEAGGSQCAFSKSRRFSKSRGARRIRSIENPLRSSPPFSFLFSLSAASSAASGDNIDPPRRCRDDIDSNRFIIFPPGCPKSNGSASSVKQARSLRKTSENSIRRSDRNRRIRKGVVMPPDFGSSHRTTRRSILASMFSFTIRDFDFEGRKTSNDKRSISEIRSTEEDL